MSAIRMSTCPEGFTSTPLKSSSGSPTTVAAGRGMMDNGVLPEDEDTFSLLSPIYDDCSDSEREYSGCPGQSFDRTSPGNNSRVSEMSESCELPKTPSDMTVDEQSPPTPTLTAWELWLVNKAKEEHRRLEKKAEEVRRLKEKKLQREREQAHRRILAEEKIQQWLQMKREQEKQEQLEKMSKEQEELSKLQILQKDTQQKAKQKYKAWLQKKNQEKVEREEKEKEDARQKMELDRERRRVAEEKFKEWLSKTNEKEKTAPQSQCSPKSPYDKSYPSPVFCNPIPWKPVHAPPPQSLERRNHGGKQHAQQKRQQSADSALRYRKSTSAAHHVQRR